MKVKYDVFFFKFYIWLSRLSSKIVENNSKRFLNWRTEANLVVNVTIKTIECLCLGTIGLIVSRWRYDVLETSIFALEASLLGQIFVLGASNFRGKTVSR